MENYYGFLLKNGSESPSSSNTGSGGTGGGGRLLTDRVLTCAFSLSLFSTHKLSNKLSTLLDLAPTPPLLATSFCLLQTVDSSFLHNTHSLPNRSKHFEQYFTPQNTFSHITNVKFLLFFAFFPTAFINRFLIFFEWILARELPQAMQILAVDGIFERRFNRISEVQSGCCCLCRLISSIWRRWLSWQSS